MPRQYTRTPLADRFWPKVAKKGPDDCWHWTGAKDSKGYGQIRVSLDKPNTSRNLIAHRVAWELTNGPIPDGLVACHTCDTPSCVNPSHIFLGTIRDNALDMVSKGRDGHGDMRGESHGCAKLTESDVIEIRRRYAAGGVSMTAIASEYGVHKTTIQQIVRRKHWTHI